MRGLVDVGERVLAATTRPGRDLAELNGAEQVRSIFEDPGSWEAAFQDVDRLFPMRPPQFSDTEHLVRPVIEVPPARILRLVVFLSCWA